jgi:hypothetical protein
MTLRRISSPATALPGLILVFLFLSSFLFSQDLSKKISLSAKNKTLEEVLTQISSRAEIRFSYSPQVIPVGKKISCKMKNVPVSEILDKILGDNGLEYVALENQVVIRPAKGATAQAVSSGMSPVRPVTVSGFVRERSSGEVLIGANLLLRETSKGTITNPYGFFSLTLPPGSYVLTASFLGFKSAEIPLELSGNRTLNIDLEETRVEMKEVVVNPENSVSNPKSGTLTDFTLNRKTLAELPGFAGNTDIVKALQTIPGIRSYGDGSALFYVRGGSHDQNLIMIDEAPVYNPSHLFGFFTAFSPDAINDVRIYKGDFPARYGGRLSSVIDIKAKEGNMKHFGVSGNFGPYASTLSVEGPIVKDRCAFIVSGRLSTLNWLNYFIRDDRSFDVQFFDINAKINYRISDRDRLYLTLYGGRDDFNRLISSTYSTYGISWNNMTGILRWNHLFSEKLFANTTLNYSQYRYLLYLDPGKKDYWTSFISNLTLKSDLAWYLNPNNTLRGGIEVTLHQSDPGNVFQSEGSAIGYVPEVAKYHSMEYVGYASNEQSFGKRWFLAYGIRIPVWQDFGPTTVYKFDGYHNLIDSAKYSNLVSYQTYASLEPRLTVRFQTDKTSFLKFNYTRSTQFLQSLSNAVGPFTSLEVWVPSGPNIKPQKDDQLSLGYFRSVWKNRLTCSAEAFYKYYYNAIDYKDHASLLYNPHLEGEIRTGNAWAYGIELMVRKQEGRLTGWVAYTYSRSFIRTPETNNGMAYPSSFDSPSNAVIHISYDTPRHWNFAATWIYMTGSPVTSPTGFYYVNGYSVPVYGERNNARLPDYHRLDLAVTYRFSQPEKRFQHSLSITVYNVYDRYNPFSVSFNKFDDGGTYVVPSNLYGSKTLVPTTISVAGVIPSINYQFRF